MNPTSVFVAREQELARLESFFDLSLQGKGQTVFVTGEAGSGKTALVTEFARLVQNKHPDVVVAYGQCNSLLGFGDPYLPFQEILQQLTGDVNEMLRRGAISEENASRLRKLFSFTGQALVDVGPELVGVFLPGVGLLAQLVAFAFDKSDWGKKLKQLAERRPRAGVSGSIDLDQNRIFVQYFNVLTRLVEKVPLILILDDLHWSDAASANLLFYLSRRLLNGRLMLVGTYRPEELALGRVSPVTGQVEQHPIDQCLNEVKRYREDVFIRLDQEDEAARREFVEKFLETEPNRLSESFRQALFERTQGNPLFTIELLRNLQERGDLQCGEGDLWEEGGELNWDDFPPRVQGVIEERISRLSKDLRSAMQVGSVEGERFTAEVLARVLEANPFQMLDQLSEELARRHRLIESKGTQQVKDLWLSVFQFHHNLIRFYVYDHLNDAQRRYLHQDVGNILEAIYGEDADSIAPQLARHFEAAGIQKKACHYFYHAGVQAAQRAANAEALELLSRGLDLASPDMLAERFDLLLARAKVYDLRGERKAQEANVLMLLEMAEKLGDERKLTRVYFQQSHLLSVIGKHNDAIVIANKGIDLAKKCGDVLQEAAGYIQCGNTYLKIGDYQNSQSNHEAGLAIIEKCLQAIAEDKDSLTAEESFDLRLNQAKGINGLAQALSNRGQADQAVSMQDEARKIFQQLGDRRGEAIAVNNIATDYLEQGKYKQAQRTYEESLAISRVIGDRYIEGSVLSNLGNVVMDSGLPQESARYHQEALRIRREINDRRGEAISLGNLGSNCGRQDDHANARRYYQEALEVFQEIGDRWGTALTIKNLGSTCLYLGEYPAAISYHAQAKEILGEMDFPNGVADCESDLGYLYYLMGDYDQALIYSRRAVDLVEKYGDFKQHLRAIHHLAYTLEALKDLTGAAEEYRHVLELLKESGSPQDIVVPLAGLARIALAQGNATQALEYMEKFLPHLTSVEIPYREYLTCYQVLEANGDLRAIHYLEEAHRLLMEHASMIPDDETRRSFLETVRLHRGIVALWKGKHPQ